MNNIYNLIILILRKLGLPRIDISRLELQNSNIVARLDGNLSVTIPLSYIDDICRPSDIQEFTNFINNTSSIYQAIKHGSPRIIDKIQTDRINNFENPYNGVGL